MRAGLFVFAIWCVACDGESPATGNGGDAGTPDTAPPAPYCVGAYSVGGASLDDAGCPPMPASPDTLDEALQQVGLNRCTLTYPPSATVSSVIGSWYTHTDPFTLPNYYGLHDHPLLMPSYVGRLTSDLDSAGGSAHPVAETLAALAARLGKTVSACDASSARAPPSGDSQPLAHAVATLISGAGGTPDEAALEAAAQGMPVDLQIAVATLVNELAQAPAAQAAYLSVFSDPTSYVPQLQTLPTLMADFVVGNELPPDPTTAQGASTLARLDVTPLAQYAIELAATVESLGLGRFRDQTGFAFSAQTPLGAIVVGDGSSNTYEPTDRNLSGNVLLLVDTGGNDTYRVPVGANRPVTPKGMVAPASLAIDLGGADDYGYDVVPNAHDVGRLPSDSAGRATWTAGTPSACNGDGPISVSTTGRQGSGILGVGMLFDFGTENDQYHSLRLSQGFGAAGVGVLYDQGGDDTYAGEDAVQGSALFGIGLLLDAAGNDTRTTYRESQGFGYTAGVGALVDLAGDDAYLANVGNPAEGGDPLYFSPQQPCVANESFSQGAAYGPRFDGVVGSDLRDMSGGLGILRDVQGSDRYQGSMFAQSASLYLGFGILVDSAGNDQYDAIGDSQATATHNSLAFFLDESGNDQYNQHVTPVMGIPAQGWDYGVSIHVDNGGDDITNANGDSLGVGTGFGCALYVNNGGSDVFNGVATSFGQVGTSTDSKGNTINFQSYGLFLKAGGPATYTGMSAAAPATTWIQPGLPTLAHGVGVDAPDAGSVQLP